MSRHRFTKAAQGDLSQIWDYTEEQWGLRQAESYIEDVRAAVERVAADPDRGRPCDNVREGYRRYPTGRHLIFYVVNGGGIDVIRILHQRMDPTRYT